MPSHTRCGNIYIIFELQLCSPLPQHQHLTLKAHHLKVSRNHFAQATILKYLPYFFSDSYSLSYISQRRVFVEDRKYLNYKMKTSAKTKNN